MPRHLLRKLSVAATVALLGPGLGPGLVACVDKPTPAARKSNVVLPNLTRQPPPPARRISEARRLASTLPRGQHRGTVGAAWVEQRLGKPTLRVLDLRPAQQFRRGHLPGATSDPEGRALLAAVMAHRRLASTNKTLALPGYPTGQTVVLVHGGSDLADRAIAARAYLLLYAAGISSKALAILRGGYTAWRQQRRPRTTAQAPRPRPRPAGEPRPKPEPVVVAARPPATLSDRQQRQLRVLLTDPAALTTARKRPRTVLVRTGLRLPPARTGRPKPAGLRFELASLEIAPGARPRTTAGVRHHLRRLLTSRDKVRFLAFSEQGLWASLLWLTLKFQLRRPDALNTVVLGQASRALATR